METPVAAPVSGRIVKIYGNGVQASGHKLSPASSGSTLAIIDTNPQPAPPPAAAPEAEAAAPKEGAPSAEAEASPKPNILSATLNVVGEAVHKLAAAAEGAVKAVTGKGAAPEPAADK